MGRYMHRYVWEPATVKLTIRPKKAKSARVMKTLTVAQLQAIARARGLTGYSRMRKDALLALLEAKWALISA